MRMRTQRERERERGSVISSASSQKAKKLAILLFCRKKGLSDSKFSSDKHLRNSFCVLDSAHCLDSEAKRLSQRRGSGSAAFSGAASSLPAATKRLGKANVPLEDPGELTGS